MVRAQREAHLYPALKRHFQRQGYQVYAELPAPHGGYMDLLAVKQARGPRSEVRVGTAESKALAVESAASAVRTVAVEMKLRFSRLALRQAARNRRFVWQSLIAVKEPFTLNRRTRSLIARRKVGLLVVGDEGVRCLIPAKEEAPAYSVKEVFGRHLEGDVASLYAAAEGGVPTIERVSAYRELTTRVRAAILARGGVASTEQILEDTLGWNYFRGRRAGLLFLLGQRFHGVAADLWATPDRARPAVHAIRMENVVKALSSRRPQGRVAQPGCAALRVILDETTEPGAGPGDIVWFIAGGEIRARALLKFAGRYPVKETPQRELRAGPAVFFPWRLAGAPPREVIVAGLTAYRDLRSPKPLLAVLKAPGRRCGRGRVVSGGWPRALRASSHCACRDSATGVRLGCDRPAVCSGKSMGRTYRYTSLRMQATQQ